MVMALSRKQITPDCLSLPVKPIKYVTENGFVIIRAADIGDFILDSPARCHFYVENEKGSRRSVTVSFADPVMLQIRLRRNSPLSERSVFWLVCAESCLAQYLWEKNEFPPDGALIISELPPDELMLALHWRDQTE